jgi:phenylacetate-coenzyme A ligase PaaK-like adenylate-forming protein
MRMARSIMTGSAIHLPSLRHLVQTQTSSSGKATADSSRPTTPNPKILQQTQERRIRRQVQLAAQDTAYYAELFARRGINWQAFTAAQISELPITTKQELRDQPEAFVRRGFLPTLRTMTTGTTGQGTTTLFTGRESQIFSTMSALGLLRQGIISKADIVQVSASGRALLGNQTFMEACRQAGALVYQTGVIDPAQTLALLAQQHKLPSRKSQASVLYTYPSYLGKLLEEGLASGYGPQDFGLERIIVGGEVSSPGLRQRSEALFGTVTFGEGYGISEVWPFGGSYCEEGHLHFDQLRGLMEVINPDTGRPAQPGEAGSLVLTPFLPYRESAIILRYDTGDMARNLVEPCTCSLNHQPATSPLLGKKKFCIRTDSGWFGPRNILELLEPNLAVPLPVRFGLWATEEGLGLEVAVREATTILHDQIAEQLQSAAIPLTTLQLVSDPVQLERPLPWRGDLHEHAFSN